MKTTTNLSLLIAILSFMLIMVSCSKERTEKQIQTEYASLNDFYDLNEPEEQTFLIDSTQNADTITGIDGTKIWGIPKEIFMIKSTQQDITYPYVLKLKEAYSIKNMIMCRLPGLAQGSLLHSAGEVKITAFKNSDELAIKNNFWLNYLSPASSTVSNMALFYGFTTGTTTDWNSDVLQTDYLFNNDNVTSVNQVNYGYQVHTAKLGWMNIGKKITPSTTATINFTATGTNTNYIDVYVVFNNLHNYIKVSNLTAANLPAGEPITVFAIAKDASGTMYYFKDNFTIANGMNIDLNMTASTESQILSMMDGL